MIPSGFKSVFDNFENVVFKFTMKKLYLKSKINRCLIEQDIDANIKAQEKVVSKIADVRFNTQYALIF